MDTALDFDFADRLRKSREAAGMGSAEMAAKLGLSRNTVTNWEHRKVVPARGFVLAWSHITKTPEDWLLELYDQAVSTVTREYQTVRSDYRLAA
jgi:transcriptional regulator with XRE-family HTH domain